MSDLAAYLRSWCGVPMVWGQTGCLPYVFGWPDACKGTSLAASVIGRYHGPREMVRHYGSDAGFIASLNDTMRGAGFKQTEVSAIGAIALVMIGKRPAAGLVVQGGRVALRTENGIGLSDSRVKPQTVWAVI